MACADLRKALFYTPDRKDRMDHARPERKPRRTITLRLAITSAILVSVGAGALVAAALTLGRALDEGDDAAITRLEAAVTPITDDLNDALQPRISELTRLRQWLLSGTADPRAPNAARALLAPLLAADPALESITLMRAGEVAFVMHQDGAAYQVPLDTVHPTRIADFALARFWDAEGQETGMPPNLTPSPAFQAREDALLTEAMRAGALAPQGNREGVPRLAWAFNPADEIHSPEIQCAIALHDGFQVDYVAALQVRAGTLPTKPVALADGIPVVVGGLGAPWCIGADTQESQRWIATAQARIDAVPPIAAGTRQQIPSHTDPAGGRSLGTRVLFPGGPALWVIAFLPGKPDLMPAFRRAAEIWVPAFLLTLVLMFLLLLGLPRTWSRMVRIANAKVELRNTEARVPRYWPATRIREFRHMQHMLDYLLHAQPQAAHPAPAAVLPEAQATPPENIEAELLQPQDQAMIAVSSQSLTPPPDAYVQALQTTRRQLRELQAEVEGLYLELQDAGTRDQELQHRLLRQRAALAEVAAGLALYGETTLEALNALAAAACAALGLARVGVWRFEDGGRRLRGELRFERLNRRGDLAPDLFRSQLPVFFLALETESVITARDAASDARLRDWLALLDETPLSASLVAIVVRRAETPVALCTFECTGQCRQWEPDEINFLVGIAHLVAPRFAGLLPSAAAAPALAAPPEPTALPAVDHAVPYRALVEHAAGMLWTLDPDGRFEYVNPTAAEAYGWDPAQMTGRFVTEFTATGFAQLERLALRAVRDGQPKYSYLTEHLCADGTTMTLAVNLAPLRDDSGAVTGCVAVAANTSHAHRREEEGSPDEQTHFRRLVEGSHELIFELDAIGCIVAVNPAVARVYGYSPDELRGEPISKLADADQHRNDLDRLSAVLQGAECTAYETRHRRKDGQPVRLLVVAEPQRNADGRIDGIIGAAVELIEINVGSVW